ncbi:DegT/DnrJ/EryC1/StrS family aminotransferase [Roseomonas terrae]|jgi:dTDP-4-amino-4,6-dideoxygalactose transaminase|uniref:DegT/DnrJ/EryC1/StrS family aminotransferase n=1 Tax=Neoroseomonas terrae TaxID=424799 RepID=A0ABS5EJ59_9PROT|nr:DegT/DnrJ/EryC1/StrS family aminotransferase [Neoroseomonas terrae]MBR0651046.1 DegT/DnrJ/EryC1/StrS family aminotransferase [Neoroseomonas terrae]
MIPLLDIRAQYEGIRTELDAAVLETLASGAYVSGPRVDAFEHDFAAYCGAREAIALNSGTSALHLALLALGIGPGDEVITTAMTFVATVAAIRYAGATPVLVDADLRTFNIDPTLIERAITPRTKAIIPVHLHGRLADMEAILRVAERHGIPVIEDAAQAHGAEWEGRSAGTVGAIGCFSFYPGKNLGACGEGGGVVTDDAALAATMRQLRDWGQAGRYNHVRHGFNYRMDGIQGAILQVKLRHLPAWTEGRRRVARIYDRLLSGSGIATPARPLGNEHVYHVYAIRSPARDRIAEALAGAGVATGMHYPRPVHLQPAYADLGYRAGAFPVAERLAREMLSLPIYPELTEAQQQHICGALMRANEDIHERVA